MEILKLETLFKLRFDQGETSLSPAIQNNSSEQKNNQNPKNFFSHSYFPKKAFSKVLTFANFQRLIPQLLTSLIQKNITNDDNFIIYIIRQNFDSIEHALLYSSENNHNEIAFYLIEKKLVKNLNYLRNDASPLLYSCQTGNLKLSKFLIENGANVNFTNSEQFTPLILACQNDNNIQLVDLLLQKGANINFSALDGTTSVISATIGRSFNVLLLLFKNGANASVVRLDGITPFWIACYKGYKEIIYLFLEQNIDLNLGFKQATPLYTSLFQNFEDIAKILIAKGVDINRTFEDWTPLMLASYKGQIDLVKSLIFRNQTIIDVSTEHNWTSLFIATQQRNEEIVRFLVSKGALINFEDRDGWTPLMIATQNNDLNIASFLIENGASVNHACFDGINCLMIASSRKDTLPLIRVLLNNKADPDIVTRKGFSATTLAKKFGFVMLDHISEERVKKPEKINGFLQKKGVGFLGLWKRRYFYMEDSCKVFYAENPDTPPRGYIDLKSVSRISSTPNTGDFQLVTASRIYELKCSPELKKIWMMRFQNWLDFLKDYERPRVSLDYRE